METLLEELLALWRRTRDPAVGDVIDLVSARIERDPIDSGPRHRRCKQWDEIAGEQDPADIPRLLAALGELSRREIEPRSGVVARWQEDPRIADGLLALIERLPQGCAGVRARPFWERVVMLIPVTADARHRDRLRQLADRLPSLATSGIAEYLPGRLRAIADMIAEPAPLTATERERCERLAEELRQVRPTPVDTAGLDALFDEVYRDPDDDGPRQVLADALLELGDRRGELIIVQLAIARGDGDVRELRRRQKQLIDRHGRDWLGGLEPAVKRSGVRFERGFVAAARVTARDASAAGCREWATVRELDVVSWPDELRSLLASPSLRWLRKLTLHDVGRETLALLADLDLPHLVELDLRDTSTPLQPADHRALWRPGGIGCHLHVLRVDWRGSVEAWLAELVEHDWPVPVVDMEACSGAWQLRVTRGPRWGQSTARFTSGRQSSLGPDPIQLLAAVLTRAPMDMFAHLEIDPVDSAGSAAWRPVHDALERWPDLIVDRAPWLD